MRSKIKINCLLSDSFTFIQGSHQVFPLSILLCIIVPEVPFDGDMKIKGIQIGHHKIKIVNFADDTTVFLRDLSCLTKTELILELSQKASSSRISFSKNQTLQSVTYKTSIDKPRQMIWSQFSIKMVGVYFHNSAHNNRNWCKISDNLTKKIHIQLSLRGKK